MGGSGSVLLINVLVARALGAAEFGVYSSVYAISSGLSLAASFGIAQFWLKAFGEEGWAARRWLWPSLKAQGIIAALSVGGMLAWAQWGPHDPLTRMMLRIMILYLIGQIALEIVSAKLQLSERYPVLAIWQAAPNLLRLAIFIALLSGSLFPFTLLTVAVVYGIVGLLMVVAVIAEVARLLRGDFNLVGHDVNTIEAAEAEVSVTRVLRESWPFGAASVVAFVYLQLDIVMVNYLAGDEAAGYYGVALSIMTAAIVLPGILYQKYLLPKYHRWANHDPLRLKRLNRTGSFCSFFCGLTVALAIILTSWLLIPIIFGSNFSRSIPIANFLSLTLPFYFLSYNSGAVLVATGGIQPKLWAMVGAAILNVASNVILIPKMGLDGAIISKGVAYLVLCASYLLFVRRHFGPQIEEAK